MSLVLLNMDGPYIKDVLLKKLLFQRVFSVLVYLGGPKTLNNEVLFQDFIHKAQLSSHNPHVLVAFPPACVKRHLGDFYPPIISDIIASTGERDENKKISYCSSLGSHKNSPIIQERDHSLPDVLTSLGFQLGNKNHDSRRNNTNPICIPPRFVFSSMKQSRGVELSKPKQENISVGDGKLDCYRGEWSSGLTVKINKEDKKHR